MDLPVRHRRTCSDPEAQKTSSRFVCSFTLAMLVRTGERAHPAKYMTAMMADGTTATLHRLAKRTNGSRWLVSAIANIDTVLTSDHMLSPFVCFLLAHRKLTVLCPLHRTADARKRLLPPNRCSKLTLTRCAGRRFTNFSECMHTVRTVECLISSTIQRMSTAYSRNDRYTGCESLPGFHGNALFCGLGAQAMGERRPGGGF